MRVAGDEVALGLKLAVAPTGRPETLRVTVLEKPASGVTVTVYRAEEPATTDRDGGVAETVKSVTVTLAVPETPPLEALTVNGPPAELPALNRPVPLMVPPPLTVQVKAGLIGLPNWSAADAVNCWVPPTLTAALAGETAIEVSVCETVTGRLLVAVSP